MLFSIQQFIHRIEVASEMRYFKYALALLTVVALAVIFDLRNFENFSTQEAMDNGQLARHIASGHGYTTSFIRPFSMFLLRRANEQKLGPPQPGEVIDYTRIRDAYSHPDISNPPAYPVLLAGLMTLVDFNYAAQTTQKRFRPDFIIALFNELLFAIAIGLVFLWARRRFDSAVAWTAVIMLLGTELLWQFSISGLPTMLLLLLFVSLVWCLTLLEEESRKPQRSPRKLFALAVAIGLLVGLGALTRYAYAWIIIPTLAFVGAFTGSRRSLLILVAFLAFASVLTPWIVRNVRICGAPFGTATYAAIEQTELYPDNHLERSLSPTIRVNRSLLWQKLFTNARAILQHPFSTIGSGWITGFFVAGLLVGFLNPGLSRMRYFLLATIALFVVVQSLARTHLSDDSPTVNSENLLVLLLPLIVVYAVAFFHVLLDQMKLPILGLRYVIIGFFAALFFLPMIFVLLLPRTSPLAYPPYYPIVIQQTAGWLKPQELMMSDIPWAVAWYGDHQCVLLTLNAIPEPDLPNSHENFLSISDLIKPINGLYLTQQTTDSRFVSDWITSGESSWGTFVVDTILRGEVPPSFPLRQMPTGYGPEQLFLSDWKRWWQ